jgi:hypothetical protein
MDDDETKEKLESKGLDLKERRGTKDAKRGQVYSVNIIFGEVREG